jgi:uncharacterized LabA/DUF88 family protein
MALVKSIVFVDGENLTFRFQAMKAQGRIPIPAVQHEPDVFVWAPPFLGYEKIIDTDIIRINYYTSKVGDDNAVTAAREMIAAQRYWMHGDLYGRCQLHPRVFKKPQKSQKSRLVDINITIDVMRHAFTDAVDVVYLFSGDGDFVDLIEEVGRSGKRICVAAFSSGLDPRLRVMADRFVLLDDFYFAPIAALDPPQAPPQLAAPAESPVTAAAAPESAAL